jgi:hypothetical protein
MIALAPDKITKRHRQLEAYVYVRQSTLKQVHQNQESRTISTHSCSGRSI